MGHDSQYWVVDHLQVTLYMSHYPALFGRSRW